MLAPALSDRLLEIVRSACGDGGMIEEPERLRAYECDGLTGHRAIPALVCLPPSVEAVQAVVRACHADGVPFVARGAGTGLSGGALPVVGGVVISVARMRRILEIDLDGGRVVVEPGVANLDVTRAVAPHGFFYAPDPSSQQVCTIGGNVAENSGGAHCLKHGFTVNHVCGLSVVLPDGELVELGGKGLDEPGPDLLGVFVGSEGTLGIAVRHHAADRAPARADHDLHGVVRLDRRGRAAPSPTSSRPGILPAAIEMMDRLTIEAAEAAVHAGYPEGAGAILITELDGVAEQVAEDMAVVEEICRRNGSSEIRVAHDDAERAVIWKGRKAAFAAVGRISPDYYVQDGVVPRTQLPGRAPPHPGALGRARPARRQRLPRRRRQPPPARPVRRLGRGRARARRAAARARSCSPASRPAARSRASTASASTRSARCR